MARKSMLSTYTGWPKPDFKTVIKTNKNFRSNYHAALMYAHTSLSPSDLKKEVTKYLKTLDTKHPILDKIKEVDENIFSTIGQYMYVLNNGGELPEEVAPNVIPFLNKVLAEEQIKADKIIKETKYINSTKEEVAIKPVQNIQTRIKARAQEIASEIEEWIDVFCNTKTTIKTVEDFTNLFKASELKAPHTRYMHTFFVRRAEEIAEVVEGKDKILNEGYSNFTKPELKKFDSFYKNLLKACEMQQEIAKVERAPKKKKPVSQEKLIAKLKYKKEDNTYGIVSVNPIQIIGAKEFWCFNCKTRKLVQYKALDERGFGIKSSTILNFSGDSIEKMLRKPKDILDEFKKASKVTLRTFMKGINAVDVPANGKLTDHHIILRIDK